LRYGCSSKQTIGRHFAQATLSSTAFFQKYAWQNQFRHHVGNTYVAVEHAKILGFVTVRPAE